MQPEHMNIGDGAVKALQQWQSAYAAIQGVGVDIAAQTPTPGTTLEDTGIRTTGALSAVSRLRGVGKEQLELLGHRLATLKNAMEQVENQSQTITTTLGQFLGATSTDRNGQLSLQLEHPEKGSTTFDLGAAVTSINQHVSTLLDALPFIALVAGDESAPLFIKLARNASEHLAQAQAAAQEAKKALQQGRKTATDLEGLLTAAAHQAEQVHAALTSVSTTKTSTEQQSAEVTQKLAQVREVSKDADVLQQRVSGFQAQFEAFEAQMKARLEQFSEFEAATIEAQRINLEREAKIEELTAKADTMIRGATTAGLSKSLEDTKDDYETRLARTQWFFLGSVGFLLVSALPIAAQLIPGPWQELLAQSTNGNATDAGPWLAALGKLIIMLPATWATAFFAGNYAELFHLSREYAHKAALAKSIDGFQREAPQYKEEIVGGVFLEIQDNPGSRKAPRAATPQNPITQRFFERLLAAIRAAKGG
jgi:hypothetical protein